MKDDDCSHFLSSVGQVLDGGRQIAQEEAMMLPKANAINVKVGGVDIVEENYKNEGKKRILEERDTLTSQESNETDADRLETQCIISDDDICCCPAYIDF